jgi:hypothetical protein
MRKCLAVLAVLVMVGAALAASDSSRQVGALKVATPGMILKIKGAASSTMVGKSQEIPVPPNKEVPLQPAKYEVAGITLCAQDKAKDIWSLESRPKALGKLASVEVAAGQTVTVEGGAPLVIKTTVTIEAGRPATDPNRTRLPPGCSTGAPAATVLAAAQPAASGPPEVTPDRTVRVILSYVGQAGEEYFPRLKKGARPMNPPIIRITEYEGKVLDEGPYKFGYTSSSGMG